ncbi:hypothetical protein AVEN_50207-1, partial [Araneus ventricosus]
AMCGGVEMCVVVVGIVWSEDVPWSCEDGPWLWVLSGMKMCRGCGMRMYSWEMSSGVKMYSKVIYGLWKCMEEWSEKFGTWCESLVHC